MDPLPSNSRRIFSRDGNGGGLSTGDIIGIAAACGCVVILILALFLWRLLSRCCRRKSTVPLPPVQNLAHVREQQLAILNANRSTVWLDDSVNSRSKRFLHSTASDVSLISGMPERKNSFYTDEGATAESSTTFPSPLSTNDVSLPPPNPMFFNTASPHSSMTSMASSSGSGEVVPVDATPPEVGSPVSDAPSDHTSFSATPRARPQPSSSSGSPHARSVSRSASRQRSRPTSMISLAATSYSGHTVQTMRTTNSIIRGAPHGPHSNVQIILPAPLAPEVYPYMQPLAEGSVSSFTIGAQTPSRGSVFADQWVMAGNSSTGGKPPPPKPSHGHGVRGSSMSSVRAAHPPSAMPPFPSRTPRRSHSQPRISLDRTTQSPSPSQTPSPQSLYAERPPPVPRIPSMYAHISRPSQTAIEPDPELDRGRSRMSRSGSQSSIPPQLSQAQQQSQPLPHPPQVPMKPRTSGEGAPRRSTSRGKLRKPRPEHVS